MFADTQDSLGRVQDTARSGHALWSCLILITEKQHPGCTKAINAYMVGCLRLFIHSYLIHSKSLITLFHKK